MGSHSSRRLQSDQAMHITTMHHGIFQSSQQYWTYRWCQSSWFRCTSGSAWQPEQHCSCSISKQSSHWSRQMLLTDGTPSMNRNNWGEESNRNRHPEGENANSPGILVTCSPTLTTPSPWRQTAINDVPNNGAKLIISGFFCRGASPESQSGGGRPLGRHWGPHVRSARGRYKRARAGPYRPKCHMEGPTSVSGPRVRHGGNWEGPGHAYPGAGHRYLFPGPPQGMFALFQGEVLPLPAAASSLFHSWRGRGAAVEERVPLRLLRVYEPGWAFRRWATAGAAKRPVGPPAARVRCPPPPHWAGNSDQHPRIPRGSRGDGGRYPGWVPGPGPAGHQW